MQRKRNALPYGYALATIGATFLVGQILLWVAPDGTSPWASPLFLLMNLLPMGMAFVFLRCAGECAGLRQFLRAAFPLRERWTACAAALAVPLVYYGVSAALGNLTRTGAPLQAALAYFPWTLLQGGLEEVGWRWYLQERLEPARPFCLRLLLLSGIWFLWHIPIYRIPWITAASASYPVVYLMLLGNTFTLGAVREFSRGAIPCIAAHMFLDTGAAVMLVGSDPIRVALMAGIEILLSLLAVSLRKDRL